MGHASSQVEDPGADEPATSNFGGTAEDTTPVKNLRAFFAVPHLSNYRGLLESPSPAIKRPSSSPAPRISNSPGASSMARPLVPKSSESKHSRSGKRKRTENDDREGSPRPQKSKKRSSSIVRDDDDDEEDDNENEEIIASRPVILEKTPPVNSKGKIKAPRTVLERRSLGTKTQGKFRPGHINTENWKKTGWFSPDEIEALERFKVEFCNNYHVTAEVFDATVQSTIKNKTGIFADEDASLTPGEFWDAIFALLPDRDRRSTRRFMHRHFQSGAKKPHQWAAEDDSELEQLHQRYGPKWAHIAREMERTYDDVMQRWKNKVEHRHRMKTGPWDEEEIRELIAAMEATYENHKQEGTENIGKDIYEMEDRHISWGAVSDRLGNTRSRQQCGDKWRRIRNVVANRRKMGELDAVYELVRARLLRPSKSPRRTPNSKSPMVKSAEHVVESDDESDKDGEENATHKNSAGSNANVNAIGNESETSGDSESDGDKEQDAGNNGTNKPSRPSNEVDMKDGTTDDESEAEEENSGEDTGSESGEEEEEEEEGKNAHVTVSKRSVKADSSDVRDNSDEDSESEISEDEEEKAKGTVKQTSTQPATHNDNEDDSNDVKKEPDESSDEDTSSDSDEEEIENANGHDNQYSIKSTKPSNEEGSSSSSSKSDNDDEDEKEGKEEERQKAKVKALPARRDIGTWRAVNDTKKRPPATRKGKSKYFISEYDVSESD